MTLRALLMLSCSVWTLSGCNYVIDHFNESYSEVTTANPITTEYDFPDFAAQKPGFPVHVSMLHVPELYKTAYIARVVYDSMLKCHKLLEDTGLTTRGVNTNFDLITTVLSALGTAFTPVGTIHVFTAAASIVSGWKGVFNSDIYGQQAAPIIGTEINSTYFAEMKKYVQDLAKRAASRESLDPALEVITITFIHQECDIDKAIGDLSAKARNTTSEIKVAPLSADDIKVGLLFINKQSGTVWKVTGVSGHMVTIQQANGKTVEIWPMDSILTVLNGSL